MMKLEDEIQQKQFRGEHHRLAVNLLYTGGWLESQIAARLSRHGLTIQQYNILRILRGRFPEYATVTLLTDRMLDKMCDASRLVDRLEVKGLALRKKCPDDRRRTYIGITDEGLALLEELAVLDRETDQLFSVLSTDEAAMVSDILDRLRSSSMNDS